MLLSQQSEVVRLPERNLTCCAGSRPSLNVNSSSDSGEIVPATSNFTKLEISQLWPLSFASETYTPLTPSAARSFRRFGRRLTADPRRNMWTQDAAKHRRCLIHVPECSFFVSADVSFSRDPGLVAAFERCCWQHLQLKATFFAVIEAATFLGLELFLDAGSLLAAVRDGGSGMIPWDSDVDLGFFAATPQEAVHVADALENALRVIDANGSDSRSGASAPVEALPSQPRRRHVVKCRSRNELKRETGDDGACGEAHYVYAASKEEVAAGATVRVELWPYMYSNHSSHEHSDLVETEVFSNHVSDSLHGPTPPLTDSVTLLHPRVQAKCRLWGRAMRCPRNAWRYLDRIYGVGGWKIPRVSPGTVGFAGEGVETWK